MTEVSIIVFGEKAKAIEDAVDLKIVGETVDIKTIVRFEKFSVEGHRKIVITFNFSEVKK